MRSGCSGLRCHQTGVVCSSCDLTVLVCTSSYLTAVCCTVTRLQWLAVAVIQLQWLALKALIQHQVLSYVSGTRHTVAMEAGRLWFHHQTVTCVWWEQCMLDSYQMQHSVLWRCRRLFYDKAWMWIRALTAIWQLSPDCSGLPLLSPDCSGLPLLSPGRSGLHLLLRDCSGLQ